MDLPVVTPCRLLADKGYDSDRIWENLLFQGALPVILLRSNRTRDIACDFRWSRDRNRIERMFNKLNKVNERVLPRCSQVMATVFLPTELRLSSAGVTIIWPD